MEDPRERPQGREAEVLPGVYVLDFDGSFGLVHAFDGSGSYGLLDVVEFLELGEVLEGEDGMIGLELDGRELLRLAALVQAGGEEHPPGFIRLCAALAQVGASAPGQPFHFYAFGGGTASRG